MARRHGKTTRRKAPKRGAARLKALRAGAVKSTRAPKRKATREAAAKSALPAGAGRERRGVVRERGPRGWLTPILESAYTMISPRGDARAAAARRRAVGKPGVMSSLSPDTGTEDIAPARADHWVDVLGEYKRRRVAVADRAMPLHRAIAGLAAVPGARNWLPLGPSAVQHGQAYGAPPVGGRVAGLAIAPGGQRIYAASANGGVFRSDDGGMQWRSLMDGFDADPTTFASTSLACGAIAIDLANPDRVYVGTGEGDANATFSGRLVDGLPAYRGIGPIRSDDGGKTWVCEPTAAGSPSLAGSAFFALAVDPTNREHVLAATNIGLYRRQLVNGQPQWRRVRAGVWCALAATRNGEGVRFFAAKWSDGVYYSDDGAAWQAAGEHFPGADVARTALAVQPNNAGLLYALVSDTSGGLRGLYRLSGGMNSAWVKVTAPPEVFPSDGKQGDYDLCIAADPNTADIVYLGGSYYNDGNLWPASIWRCVLKAAANGSYRALSKAIGKNVHADVHCLVHAPGDSHALWATCDGGMFVNRDPTGSGTFASRNNGLACLCTTFFAQHPTDPSILFCGLQDNGTARTGGGAIWTRVNSGDGGYCAINWADPQQVLGFADGVIYRSSTGGMNENDWTYQKFPWETMTEPIVTTPYNPQRPAEARRAAFGTGNMLYVSEDFGAHWASSTQLAVTGAIYALAFATATRLFVGTTKGEVLRVDKVGATWQATRLDNAAGGALPLNGIISDVAPDWHDAGRESCYVAFGGIGDYRHVWYFDGTRWLARSGPAGRDNLLDVEHNALAIDPVKPQDLYVGADIGVWRSQDGGATWAPMANGLPDAPVFDLQIHPTRRLLRAATHGRGMFEIELD